MTDTNLSVTIMNNTASATFYLYDSSGISQPPSPIAPGMTTFPPIQAGSDFQVKGFFTYSDGNGGGVTGDFYMPVIGHNSFTWSANPEGRYTCEWVGDQTGWNDDLVFQINDGDGNELTEKPDA